MKQTAGDCDAATGRAGTGPDRPRSVLRYLRDMSVRTKLVGAVLTVASVAVLVSTLALLQMARMNANSDAMYADNLLPVRLIDSVLVDMERARRDALNHTLSSNAETMARYEQALRDDDVVLARDLDAYAARRSNTALLATLRDAWTEYSRLRDQQLLPASRARDYPAAERIRDSMRAPATRAEDAANSITEAERASAKGRRDANDHAARSALVITIVVLVAGIGAALGYALWVTATILSGLRRVSVVIDALAACDLTRSADLDSRDEFGVMGHGLDTAITSVRATVSDLATTAIALSTAARQLSSVSTELDTGASEASARASGAAAAAEQVNSGVHAVTAAAEQMTASIGEIAGSSAQAATVSHESILIARQTNEQIQQLGAASVEIGQVVDLITSIAEQTNLLALNATIEAAHAGELGKGFAVVAAEVKELAQQTARATGDITTRIKTIQDSSIGAADAVGRIGAVVEQINEYNMTIASAVEEQSATTDEIARAIGDAARGSAEVSETFNAVAEVAGATARSAGASRDAADELSAVAAKLNSLVQVFRY